MTFGRVAQITRQNKDRHPSYYCSHPGCLWRVIRDTVEGIKSVPCPKHGVMPPKADVA